MSDGGDFEALSETEPSLSTQITREDPCFPVRTGANSFQYLAKLIVGKRVQDVKSGRKKRLITLVLELFVAKSGRKVKFDTFRVHLVREFLGLIKKILLGKTISKNPMESKYAWKMQEIVLTNRELFERITDKKNRPAGNSYNDAYCACLFQTDIVQVCYDSYTQLLFSNMCPGMLCTRFKLRCCYKKEKHVEKCERLWEVLRLYVQEEMLRELRVKDITTGDTETEVKIVEAIVEERLEHSKESMEVDWESLLNDH